jgi:hypothetical protein
MSDATGPHQPPVENPGNLARIQFIREEIRFEHIVLGNRISAYLASQAFLITAFAISGQAIHRSQLDYMLFAYLILPMVGALISRWIYLSVAESVARIDKQRELIYCQSSPLRSLIDQLRPEVGNKEHRRSLVYAVRVPILFGCLWMAIFAWGVLIFVSIIL